MGLTKGGEALIGIIANPASGKDIRRLVTYATVVDNQEKVNIVKRIILAAQACGVKEILIMPDTYQIGLRAIEDLKLAGQIHIEAKILPMNVKGNQSDSSHAAALMEELGVKCLVILGGDGTSRAVAKTVKGVPILPLSTGTNNVYPEMLEGTVAGMAAAAVARGYAPTKKTPDKRIEVYKSGELVDIALVDAVISSNLYQGARAIWHTEEILKVIATRCHPASIGFSALLGCRQVVRESDDFGISVDLGKTGQSFIAPIGAGLMEKIQMQEPQIWQLNREYNCVAPNPGMIALDGEREVEIAAGELITFKITRRGPLRVKVKEALEAAQEQGFFHG